MSHEKETKQTPAAETKAPETEAKAPEQETPKAEKPEEKHEGKHHHETAALQAKLDEAEKKNEELKNQLLRTAAEYDNYRKRSQREADQKFNDGVSHAVTQILGILDTLDMAATAKFEEVLLVGHVGKLCKLAAGVMNTHSHTADGRAEVFCAHAALCGAAHEVCAALMDAATTDACLDILDGAQLRAPVLESILAAIQMHLDRRAGGAFRVGAVLFSNQHGPLGETKTAKELMQEWQN